MSISFWHQAAMNLKEHSTTGANMVKRSLIGICCIALISFASVGCKPPVESGRSGSTAGGATCAGATCPSTTGSVASAACCDAK